MTSPRGWSGWPRSRRRDEAGCRCGKLVPLGGFPRYRVINNPASDRFGQARLIGQDMGRLRFALIIIAALTAAAPLRADAPLTALARPEPARSEIIDFGNNIQITLALSQPVMWRVFTLDGPARLVFDFSEVAFEGFNPHEIVDSDRIPEVAAGPVREGWSRMVLALDEPMLIETAGLVTATEDGTAVLKAQLAPTDAKTFAAKSGAPETEGFVLPEPAEVPPPRPRWRGDRPLVVALDPGHGGIDPGAEGGGVAEADLMLSFAGELRDVLEATGRIEVAMTRNADLFVPLETRVTKARAAGADLFLSLHADALETGRASGATIYTLAADASDEASQKLAERHDRDDLLAGLDLTHQDDQVAGVLMDLARVETQPRSDALADAIVHGIAESTGDLHKRPRLSAAFSVLKAPDIPSVLIELGFLSSRRDRANLTSEAWRLQAAEGIRDAVLDWAEADAAQTDLLRQ